MKNFVLHDSETLDLQYFIEECVLPDDVKDDSYEVHTECNKGFDNLLDEDQDLLNELYYHTDFMEKITVDYRFLKKYIPSIFRLMDSVIEVNKMAEKHFPLKHLRKILSANESKKLNESFLYETETRNNKERIEEIAKYFKSNNYHNYQKTLNNMLEDNKIKPILVDGFGGDLDDAKLKYTITNIKVKNLVPTQIIDPNKAIEYSLINPNVIDAIYKSNGKNIVLGFPIITFRKNYIIDGHQRWCQIYAMNPNTTVTCFDYDGDLAPYQIINLTQNGNIECENNLFDKKWNENKFKEYIKNTASDDVVEVLSNYNPEIQNMENVCEFITNNLKDMKQNNR